MNLGDVGEMQPCLSIYRQLVERGAFGIAFFRGEPLKRRWIVGGEKVGGILGMGTSQIIEDRLSCKFILYINNKFISWLVLEGEAIHMGGAAIINASADLIRSIKGLIAGYADRRYTPTEAK